MLIAEKKAEIAVKKGNMKRVSGDDIAMKYRIAHDGEDERRKVVCGALLVLFVLLPLAFVLWFDQWNVRTNAGGMVRRPG